MHDPGVKVNWVFYFCNGAVLGLQGVPFVADDRDQLVQIGRADRKQQPPQETHRHGAFFFSGERSGASAWATTRSTRSLMVGLRLACASKPATKRSACERNSGARSVSIRSLR